MTGSFAGAPAGRDDVAVGFVGELAGAEAFHHCGDNAGCKAFAARLPASDRRRVLLTNQDEVDSAPVGAVLSEPAIGR